MKAITLQSTAAFMASQPFSKGNMSVEVNGNITRLRLHGNTIATKCGSGPGAIYVLTDAGWQTHTTKERLNGLLDMLGCDRVYQRDFAWYQGDGAKWLGSLIVERSPETHARQLTHVTREQAGSEIENLRAAA